MSPSPTPEYNQQDKSAKVRHHLTRGRDLGQALVLLLLHDACLAEGGPDGDVGGDALEELVHVGGPAAAARRRSGPQISSGVAWEKKNGTDAELGTCGIFCGFLKLK